MNDNEQKNISDTESIAIGLMNSSAMTEVKKAYDSVYSSLTTKATDASITELEREEARRKIEIIRFSCTLFTTAGLAYQDLNDRTLSDSGRIYRAGSNAERFFVQLHYFKEITDTDDSTVEDKLQTISDWLETKNWITIPSYVNQEGMKVHVTAHGMLVDMRRMLDAMKTLRNAAVPERKESKRGITKPDFDKIDFDTQLKPSPTHFERRVG